MITRQTLVVDAWRSCRAAPDIFRRHGIDPGQQCSVVRDTTVLEDAEDWCGLRDLDGLVAELNAAVPQASSAS